MTERIIDKFFGFIAESGQRQELIPTRIIILGTVEAHIAIFPCMQIHMVSDGRTYEAI